MVEKSVKISYKFRYSERLHHNKDFVKVLKSGRKLVRPAIFVYIYCRNDGSDLCRLGLVTSGKIGKAVERNKVKRRLREIFRLNKHLFKPGYDIIFMPKTESKNLSYSELKKNILELLKTGKLLK